MQCKRDSSMQSCPFGSPRLHFEEYPWPVPRPACDCEAPTVAMLTHVPSLFLATLSRSVKSSKHILVNCQLIESGPTSARSPDAFMHCSMASPKKAAKWQNTANLQRRCFALRLSQLGSFLSESTCSLHATLEAFWNLNEGSKNAVD